MNLKNKKFIFILLSAICVSSIYSEYHMIFNVKDKLNNITVEPSCITKEKAVIGDKGDNFCGHEGLEVVYAGEWNSEKILISLNDDSTTGWSDARNVCISKNNLEYTIQWHSPTLGELRLLWNNKDLINLSEINIDTTGQYYWTTTNSYSWNAYTKRFSDGREEVFGSGNFPVRCARYF